LSISLLENQAIEVIPLFFGGFDDPNSPQLCYSGRTAAQRTLRFHRDLFLIFLFSGKAKSLRGQFFI